MKRNTFTSETKNLQSYLIVFDDTQNWRSVLLDTVITMPETAALITYSCSNEQEATELAKRYGLNIIGYIYDLQSGGGISDLNILGVGFFNRIVDPYSPTAKCLLLSVRRLHNNVKQNLRRIHNNRIDFIEKELFDVDELRRKVLWLIDPINIDKETPIG